MAAYGGVKCKTKKVDANYTITQKYTDCRNEMKERKGPSVVAARAGRVRCLVRLWSLKDYGGSDGQIFY